MVTVMAFPGRIPCKVGGCQEVAVTIGRPYAPIDWLCYGHALLVLDSTGKLD